MAAKHPELECYVFDKLIESQKYELDVASYCEDRFLQIVSDLPGFRASYCWITPPGTSLATVANSLNNIPHNAMRHEGSIKIELGLHRNCWDYEIFVPQISDTSKPVVTVLIPFFNAGERIVKAVSSVFLQSIQQFELILIDDAARDNSVNYLLPFINDPRVRLLSCPENQGLSNALNLGLTHSSAQIIVHLDSDDWLEPNALEEICACFNIAPNIGAISIFIPVIRSPPREDTRSSHTKSISTINLSKLPEHTRRNVFSP